MNAEMILLSRFRSRTGLDVDAEMRLTSIRLHLNYI